MPPAMSARQDEAMFEEVRNVARALTGAVSDMRSGMLFRRTGI